MSKTVVLSDRNFDTEVKYSDVPVLVDFWAPWCSPCRRLSPVIDELAYEYKGKVKIAKVNVEENPLKTSEFRISGIPTVILFNNGEIKERMIGLQTKPILKHTLDTNM